jgi:hypothetical protein
MATVVFLVSESRSETTDHPSLVPVLVYHHHHLRRRLRRRHRASRLARALARHRPTPAWFSINESSRSRMPTHACDHSHARPSSHSRTAQRCFRVPLHHRTVQSLRGASHVRAPTHEQLRRPTSRHPVAICCRVCNGHKTDTRFVKLQRCHDQLCISRVRAPVPCVLTFAFCSARAPDRPHPSRAATVAPTNVRTHAQHLQKY